MLEERGGDSMGLCRELVRGFAEYDTDPMRFKQMRHRLMVELDGR